MAFDFNGEGEILCVDKPPGWTSFDVVRKVRNVFHIRKIGHAGTLDPMATGLLVLCTGPKTKKLDTFLAYDKEYSGTFEIGIETASYDKETPVVERKEWGHITEELLRSAVHVHTGPLEQIPPMYSALKHKGRALYKYARAGEHVERSPRRVVVHDFSIGDIAFPVVSFTLRCSKGTYVRSLVHDVGVHLGTGAVLTALRRESVGPWKVSDAFSIPQLLEMEVPTKQNEIKDDALLAKP